MTAMGNAIQGFYTLHYTRRIYNGLFVPNTKLPAASAKFNPEDSVNKLVSAPSASGKDAGKAKDQVTPFAGRLFGTYTFVAGLIRFYAAYEIENHLLYQLAIWTHVVAAMHFTSEMLIFKGFRFSGPQIFPFMAAYGGMLWMFMQYKHYVV
jgi:hypothetical protein